MLVYGLSPRAAPTMAVPHLDSRILEGKKALLFGPYAAWTTSSCTVEAAFLIYLVRLNFIIGSPY